MSSPVTHVQLADPGPGRRLDRAARDELRTSLRSAAREKPGSLVITVEGGCWDQAPEIDSTDPAEFAQASVSASFSALTEQLFQFPCPVLVALDGPVSGFGLTLCLAADVRFVTPATTFSMGGPANAAALLGGAGWLVTRAVGAATFADLAWTGATLDAETAALRGLVSGVSPRPEAAIDELTGMLSALPAGTTSALKRATTARLRPDLSAALDYESWLVGVATGSAPV
jgi:enoyl-CoA hydratase/carnithine racemase